MKCSYCGLHTVGSECLPPEVFRPARRFKCVGCGKAHLRAAELLWIGLGAMVEIGWCSEPIVKGLVKGARPWHFTSRERREGRAYWRCMCERDQEPAWVDGWNLVAFAEKWIGQYADRSGGCPDRWGRDEWKVLEENLRDHWKIYT